MAQLQQLNVSFDAEQDRLLFKVRASDGTEIRLWLTRRYVKLLWGVLKKMAENLSGAVVHQEQDKREAVLAFAHEEAVAKTDFRTPYKTEEVHHPLGEEPILVSKIQRRAGPVKSGPGQNEILRMAPSDGQGIELTADNSMLHSICQLIANGVKKTDWDLNLQLFSGPAKAPKTALQQATRH